MNDFEKNYPDYSDNNEQNYNSGNTNETPNYYNAQTDNYQYSEPDFNENTSQTEYSSYDVTGSYEPASSGSDSQFEQYSSEPVNSFEYVNNNEINQPLSDSDYMNANADLPKETSFYTTNTKPVKKKKYVSVGAAVAALAITAVISIAGGAALSGLTLSSGLININKVTSGTGNAATVKDNIDNSKSYQGGSTVTHNTLNGEALTTPEIVDKVGPAVVGIINKTTYGNAYGFYGSLYGNMDDEIEQSSGSGVIISSDGYIVTNNHVVENATAISVILNTGEEYDAKIIGKDASTDLAVLKIEAANLVYAQMGSSSSLRVGEPAIAIGNPLGQEFAGTTTQGIISGLNRSVTVENKTMNLIQTDAAINPGNSGGALVNEYGVLIGINTIKISSDTLEGLGFAIPIDEAKPVIQELITNGYVTGRPIIGIGGRAVTKEDAEAYNLKVGVYVSSMTPSGPAYMAGLKIGDIIVECEGEPIETVDDINEIKNKKNPGDQIAMKVYRKGNYIDVAVILGEEVPGE